MSGWNPQVVAVDGRFVAASNATLLGTTADGDRVVYKPVAGEQPLWDFAPETLAVREVLTYELSEAMGLGIVPETAMGDGVYGVGSVQRFIDVDESFDPLAMVRAGDAAIWPLAVLDVVANNADRKLGHILRTAKGVILGIDHGLTFHHEDKLRTVLWSLAGSAVPDELLAALDAAAEAMRRGFGERVEDLLGAVEARALRRRIDALRRWGVHPQPPDDRPALPWPPY